MLREILAKPGFPCARCLLSPERIRTQLLVRASCARGKPFRCAAALPISRGQGESHNGFLNRGATVRLVAALGFARPKSETCPRAGGEFSGDHHGRAADERRYWCGQATMNGGDGREQGVRCARSAGARSLRTICAAPRPAA